MTQNITTLPWLPIASQAGEWAATVPMNTSVDTLWRLSITGAPNDAPANVVPNYLIIDNMNNNGLVNLSFGNMLYVVPQYSRKTFRIPKSLRSALVNCVVGIVNAIFVVSQYAPDDANLLLIQQTAGAVTVLFPHKTYSVSTNQSGTDQNAYIEFAPVAAGINYNLLPVGLAPLIDGWVSWVKNTGTKNVSIKPNGADVINGVYTNAAPLVLQPGDNGFIQYDGSSWNFSGHTTFTSPDIAPTLSIGGSLPHGMGMKPTTTRILWRFIVAVAGYSIGDVIDNRLVGNGAGNMDAYTTVKADAVNVVYRNINAITSMYVLHLTTGTITAIAAASNDLVYNLQCDLWQ